MTGNGADILKKYIREENYMDYLFCVAAKSFKEALRKASIGKGKDSGYALIITPKLVEKDFIYYQETDSVLECGEILPYQIFHLFTDTKDIKRLYVFPYPNRKEDGTAAYYSFEPTEEARREIQNFLNRIYDKLCRGK